MQQAADMFGLARLLGLHDLSLSQSHAASTGEVADGTDGGGWGITRRLALLHALVEAAGVFALEMRGT